MENEKPRRLTNSIRIPFFLNPSKNPVKKLAFFILVGLVGLVGVVGVVGVVILIGGFLTFRQNKLNFNFSSSDIVYGEKVIALHTMNEIPTQDEAIRSISDDSSYPSIQVSESFFDFGSVRSDQVYNHRFIIANTGSSPLMIQQAFTTCGCTLAEISTNKIPPGKAAQLTLQFDPSFHNMSGSTVRRGVIIYTNDPNHPTQEIWIQASVR